jgi:hypothetical protein
LDFCACSRVLPVKANTEIEMTGKPKLTPLAILIVAALGLSACAEIVGAGAGAAVGNQFGKGEGNTAATIGGAAAGAALGHVLSN